MTTREYLSQIRKINLMIEAKVEDSIRLRTLATKITVPTDGERVKSSPDPDKLTNVVAKIVELDREIEESVKELIKKRKIIYRQIEEIENPEYYSFLIYKYTQFLQSKEIAGKMNVSKSVMFTIQAQALLEFEKKYGSEYLLPTDEREKGVKVKWDA